MMNMYEQPWLLFAAGGMFLFGIVVLNPKKYKWRLLALSFLIIGAAFAIDSSVETDREKIKRVIVRISRAAQNEDIPEIGRHLTDDYHDSVNKSKREVLSRLEMYLNEPLIDRNVTRIVSIEVNLPTAKAIFTVRVVFEPQGQVFDLKRQMIFKLEADLIKRGNNWYFRTVELVELDMHPMDWQHINDAFREVFGRFTGNDIYKERTAGVAFYPRGACILSYF